MVCLICGYNIEPGDYYCKGCVQVTGETDNATCAHCGMQVQDGDAFCVECGMEITAMDAEPQLPESAAEDDSAQQPAPAAALMPQLLSAAARHRMLLLFMVDNSASALPYIDHLYERLNRFFVDVRNDDEALNSLDLAVIQFNESYNVFVDFPDVTYAHTSDSITEGNASYSEPIREAIGMAEEHSKNHAQSYKPWIIMITAGKPSDDVSAVADEVQAEQDAGKLRFMALGVLDYNADVLKRLTDVVFRQDGIDFASFFDWLRKCIGIIVRTVPGEKPQLPNLDGNIYRDR